MGKSVQRSKIVKSMTVLALSSSFLLASFGNVTNVSKAVSSTNVEDMLAKLTPTQRAALNQLSTNESTGLKISSDKDLNTTEQANVIVEFVHKPAKVAQIEASLEGQQLSATEATQLVDQDHNTFQEDVDQILTDENNSKVNYKINRIYEHSFNGVSISLPANQIKNLLKSKAVKNVWSDETFSINPPNLKEQSEQLKADEFNIENYSPYDGLDRLHAEGYTGKGIKIGILDTGIDYNHPDLKDAYKGGYDFVDNDNDPMEATYADWKKSGKPEISGSNTFYTEHGTHVAGIIGSRGVADTEYKTVGAAPEADIYSYRVLGPYGSGKGADIIAALDKAVSDGMDIINMSLGATINDPLFATSVAVNNAVLSGVTTVVAAGNSGNGMYTLGSPGSSALALTVGASTSAIDLFQFSGFQNSKKYTIRELARNYTDDLTALKGKTFNLVDVGLGKGVDYNGKDVKGKIAFIQRGDTSFIDKIKLAKAKGAVAVIIYNNDVNKAEGIIQGYVGESLLAIPTFSMSNEDGLAISNAIKQGSSDFTFGDYTKFKTPEDELTSFSSRGPSRINYDIKPEVTAPGAAILSTVPFYVNNKTGDGSKPEDYKIAYERLSGTSMATPYVAGVSALLLQSNKNLQPADIKSILMNTADPLKKDYSVFEVGSGRVDAYEAIHSNVELNVVDSTPTIIDGKEKSIKELTGAMSFGSFSFKNEEIAANRQIILKNSSEQVKTFSIDVKYQTGLRGSKDANLNDVTLTSPSSVTLDGSSQKPINFHLKIPANAEKGIYEGYIVFTNDADQTEQYQIPFGVHYVKEGFNSAATYNKMMTSDYTNYYPLLEFNAGATFNLSSSMETIDFVLLDSETDEEIGYLGQIPASQLDENTDYYVTGVFTGYYNPFTNDPKNPVSPTSVKVPYGPAHYKIKMIGTNRDGKTFSMTDHVMVDITGPTFTTDLEEGVIEVKPGTTSYPIKGTVFDKTQDDYRTQGISIDQSGNFVMIKNNNTTFSNGFNVDAKGNFAYNIPIDPSAKSVNVELAGYNSAKIGTRNKYFTFIPEGTPLVYGSVDQKIVNAGENVKVNLTAYNVTDAKKIASSLSFSNNQLEFVDVKLNPAIEKFGSAKLTSNSAPSGLNTNVNVNIEMTNGKVTGDVPFAEVTLKVKDNTYNFYSPFKSSSASYINESNQSIAMNSTIPPIWFKPTYSKISGSIGIPVSLQKEGKSSWRVAPSQIGAVLSVKDQNGNIYPGVINQFGQVSVDKLPKTLDEMVVSLDIPGHFTIYEPFHVGFLDDEGVLTAHWNPEINFNAAIPGDVNKDNVIDLKDALAIQTNWGTDSRSADINFDKIVDAKDFAFIEKNYLMQNPTVENAPKPLEKYKSKSLEDIKKELGLN
ncbi:S8 family serine peptidase [Bacillus sp. UNCCL81]|uniref:S8 family serine peptidase n=1 Tax=Bacillus sp. UNCCL81 TaxID=1502755 RepID=UPI0008E95222|nr:S8 family serine peptidase [Bacillus sp. UNCCL81]SFD77611.1 Fn3-like domain-containing protein [Bacillus sp. UNCCL81]